MQINYNESLYVSYYRYVIVTLNVNLIYFQKRIIRNVKKSIRRCYN